MRFSNNLLTCTHCHLRQFHTEVSKSNNINIFFPVHMNIALRSTLNWLFLHVRTIPSEALARRLWEVFECRPQRKLDIGMYDFKSAASKHNLSTVDKNWIRQYQTLILLMHFIILWYHYRIRFLCHDYPEIKIMNYAFSITNNSFGFCSNKENSPYTTYWFQRKLCCYAVAQPRKHHQHIMCGNPFRVWKKFNLNDKFSTSIYWAAVAATSLLQYPIIEWHSHSFACVIYAGK